VLLRYFSPEPARIRFRTEVADPRDSFDRFADDGDKAARTFGLVEHVGDPAIAGDRGVEPFVCVALSAMFQVVAAGFDVVELRDDDERGRALPAAVVESAWQGQDRGPAARRWRSTEPERGFLRTPRIATNPGFAGLLPDCRCGGRACAPTFGAQAVRGEDPDNGEFGPRSDFATG
jgi:hypothetical protein